MTGSTPRRAGWIPELAGYRAVAALAVFAFHLASIDAPGGLLGRLTVPLGNAAVSLFFVLSGFLVYRPFAEWALFDAPPVATWRFIVRRLARILPLYWVVLTIHFLVTEPDKPLGVGEYLTSYLLIQNFRGTLVFLPPFVAWSLCIELWFSVALPFIAAPLRRAARGRRLIERTQIQFLGIGLLAGTSIVFRIWALGTPGDGRVLWMPAYLDWFAAGLLLAVLRAHWSKRPPTLEVRQLATHPLYLSSLGLLSYWSVTQLGLPGGFITPTRFQTHAQFLLQGLMSLFLVAAVVLPGADLGRARRFFASRTLQWLGAISYGIYLIHPVVTDELVELLPDVPLGLIAPIALIGTLLLADGLHRLVEAPSSRIVDRWVTTKRSSPSRPTAPTPTAPITTAPITTAQITTAPITTAQITAAPTTASDRTTSGPTDTARRPSTPKQVLATPRVQGLLLACLAFTSPLLSLPNRYVADSRFELTFNPTARLDRMFVGWDAGRGLGRPAEEFWPFLTFVSSGLDQLGISPWLLQRLVHGSLLTLAAVGMLLLAHSLDHRRPFAAPLAALLFTFGPASSLYLLPIPLYTSYAAAPWLALAVVRAAQRRPLRWAGLVAVIVFLVGNADPPGFVLACVPAGIFGISLFIRRPAARRRLLGFATAGLLLAVLVSAAMLMKTTIGSAALAHRLAETESIDAVALASSFGESIRGAGFWLLYFGLSPTTFRTHLSLFTSNGWVVMATVAPLVVGLAALGRRPSRVRLLALSWVLIGVVLMVGPYPTSDPTPWGRALIDLFTASDEAFAFRSSHKAGVIVAMGTALLAAWAAHDVAARIKRSPARWRRVCTIAASTLGVTILATVAAPFWATPLYDTDLSVGLIPDYWDDASAQLEAEADGRVLVVPGSTNNGYRWGTIGDDLIDVLVPSPIAASTLPLSTPIAADVIDALDRAITAQDYQPGTLAPIAERLGITHLVIRNDLAWELQGLPRPADLDALRGDPDLTLVGRHGTPGRFVVNPLSPEPIELALPPIEIYRIDTAAPPKTVVLPAEGTPRTIVVDGAGAALVSVAEQGLLGGGHVVRFLPSIDAEASVVDDALSDDVALVVVTATTRSIDRRIEYYGYRFAPALDPADANDWLGVNGVSVLTTVDLDGAAVTSSVDRWLLGLEHQPLRAFDGDPATSWRVPRLVQDDPQQLSLSFDEATAVDSIVIVLDDAEQRIDDLLITVDGQAVEAVRSDDRFELESRTLTNLTIEIGPTLPGLAAVGVVDVIIDTVDVGPLRPVTHVGAGIADYASALPNADQIPALFLIGPEEPSEQPMITEVTTWLDRPHEIAVSMQTQATVVRCLPFVTIDGEPVRMLIRPIGDGIAIAGPCAGGDPIDLTPGTHRIEVTPPPGDAVTDVRLTAGSLDLDPVTRIPLADEEPGVGDIVVLPDAFDVDWSIDTVSSNRDSAAGGRFAADGLTGIAVDTAGPIERAAHPADVAVTRSWWVTIFGLVMTAAAIALPGRTPQQREHVPVQRRRLPTAVLAPGLGVAAAWLFGGPIAIAGAAAAWCIHRWLPRVTFISIAALLMTVIAYRVSPLLEGTASIIDPARADQAMRIVIGMLLMAGIEALRRIGTVSDGSPR